MSYLKTISDLLQRMADNSSTNNQQRGLGALSQHVSAHKLEMGLWATRILTIFFTIAYFLPIFPAWLAGGHPVAAYHKVLNIHSNIQTKLRNDCEC